MVKMIKYYNLPENAVEKELAAMEEINMVERIWQRDHTVWKEDPAEISNRLGWLQIHRKMGDNLQEIRAFCSELLTEGYNRALLLGMGGSSLAPEVFSRIFGAKAGYLDLEVLDSTSPGAVLEKGKKLNYDKTLFITSTKSGGTVETISLMKYFYNIAAVKLGREGAGKHFTAITDPGSGLEKTARELCFRKIFLNDPTIGGRYSALSYFGLVPAALIGVDLEIFLQKTTAMEEISKLKTIIPRENSPAWLGAVIGTSARLGRDKLTLLFSPSIFPLGAWIEQLIAESTGKEGQGILPVYGETPVAPQTYANDRIFVVIKLQDDQSNDDNIRELTEGGLPLITCELKDETYLGSEMFRWMMATAVAGWSLKINPFDQPNVEAAKVLARQKIARFRDGRKVSEAVPALKTSDLAVYSEDKPDSLQETWKVFLSHAAGGDNEGSGRSYIAIHAYLKPDPETDLVLQKLRDRLVRQSRMAVSVGYGPRLLHSTGQLHKGDGGKGLFIQLTCEDPEDIPIPDEPGGSGASISFAMLINAQAAGDRQALKESGRKVLHFHFEKNQVKAIESLTEAI